MSDATEPVLELRDVAVEYPGGIRAIDGIRLRVFPHDLLGLLGPNGAGKSTLLGLDEPTSGMDAQSRREFYLMLVHLNRDLGITIVLTSHEVHSVTKLASRIAFLSGTLLFDGDPVAFERHPAHIDLEDFPEAVMPKP